MRSSTFSSSPLLRRRWDVLLDRKVAFALSLLVTIVLSCSQTAPERMHERFTLTTESLESLIEDTDDHIRTRILDRPWYFLDLIEQVLEEPPDRYVLVDKDHALPESHRPTDLVSLNDYPLAVNRPDLRLSRSIMPDVLALNEAAAIDGVTLVFSSAYRSYDYQKGLYQRHVKNYGVEQANRESAKPGHSQHQLGTTIDFGSITDAFAETAAGKWLKKNAWEFGFSLSYPAGMESVTGYRHEIWHYRYIGRSAALLEREFFGSVQQNMLEFLDMHAEDFRAAWLGGTNDT